MDQLRVYTKIFIIVLTISQVWGNPMFFWNQQDADCSQENNNDNTYQNNYPQQNPYPSYQVPSYQSPSYQESSYQAPGYQGSAYQGPSYQETLQAMIADTLRALCDIVQSTVQASKQEVATLARMFIKKSSQSDCESDEVPEDEYNVRPSALMDNNLVEPQSATDTGMDTLSSSSKPDLLMQTHNNSTNSTSNLLMQTHNNSTNSTSNLLMQTNNNSTNSTSNLLMQTYDNSTSPKPDLLMQTHNNTNSSGDVHNSTSLASSLPTAGLNETSTSPSMTKPANSTTEKTNSGLLKETVSMTGALSSNKNVSEVTNLTY